MARKADIALQAIATRIGVSVEGLEHLEEAIGALEHYAEIAPFAIIPLNLLSKLKGKDNG